MKKLIILILLLTQILYGCKQQDINVYDTEGHLINFSELRHQWIVINYWASWCPPCVKEIPELNQLYQMYKNDNVAVLGVNYDRVDQQQLQQIITEMGVEFPTLITDPAEQLGIGEIAGLPVTYIFNPQGKLSARLYGAQTRETLLSAMHIQTTT